MWRDVGPFLCDFRIKAEVVRVASYLNNKPDCEKRLKAGV